MPLVHSRSIAATATGRDRAPPVLLAAGVGLLPAGLVLPLMTIETFFVFSEEFSILDSLVTLLREGEVLLFVLLGFFGIALPVGRLAFATVIWFAVPADETRFDRLLGWITALGKWSLLEVLILAVAIVSTKLSLLGDAHTNPGIYLFTAAIGCQIAGFHWLRAAGARVRAREAPAPLEIPPAGA